MKYYLIFFYALLFLSCTNQSEFYISPSGADSNPGTKKKPFLTISRAQVAVRKKLMAGQTRNITIWINDGIYKISQNLLFGPGDSGQKHFRVIYRAVEGTKPVISGGIGIREWKKSDKGYWIASLPLPKIKNQQFRELFIDGKRATRARHPNNGFLRIAKVGPDRRTNFWFNKGDFPVSDNPNQVEIVVLHDWSISRIPAAIIDYDRMKIIAVDSIGAKSEDFFNLDAWEKNPRYFLENSLSFLDSTGEWYYDPEAELIYLKLKEDQNPENLNITVPLLGPNLLKIEGRRNQRVKNIDFIGLSFQYCSWTIPEKGYAGIQACFYDSRPSTGHWAVVPACAELNWTENCTFRNCSFLHLGGSGVWLGTGCVDCEISDSKFEDISCDGVMVGEGNDRQVNGGLWWKTVPEQVAQGNLLVQNTISDCGTQFFGAVGIWCGLTGGTSVIKNHVFNLPYTGISVGWYWSSIPTPCRNNQITGNHIDHIMETLSDGGGIYMLGLQPGSSISDNLIHDVSINAGRAESNGMFFDQGTADVTISGNIIFNIAKSPVRFHQASNNLLKDNVLVCEDGIQPVMYNRTPETNIRLENNIRLQKSEHHYEKMIEDFVAKWKVKYTDCP